MDATKMNFLSQTCKTYQRFGFQETKLGGSCGHRFPRLQIIHNTTDHIDAQCNVWDMNIYFKGLGDNYDSLQNA